MVQTFALKESPVLLWSKLLSSARELCLFRLKDSNEHEEENYTHEETNQQLHEQYIEDAYYDYEDLQPAENLYQEQYHRQFSQSFRGPPPYNRTYAVYPLSENDSSETYDSPSATDFLNNFFKISQDKAERSTNPYRLQNHPDEHTQPYEGDEYEDVQHPVMTYQRVGDPTGQVWQIKLLFQISALLFDLSSCASCANVLMLC